MDIIKLRDMLELVAPSGSMLDPGCQILDILDHSNSKVEKHPASRDQYRDSDNVGNGFCSTTLY